MLPQNEPLIFCGDLNAGAYSPVYRRMSAHLVDVQKAVRQKGYPRATFFSFYRILRLDHIFVSHHVRTLRVHVPIDAASKKASDHLPLLAELEFNDFRPRNLFQVRRISGRPDQQQ
jgi:endonuclease/exonuclease/phosphatase family metal-dependent hydrolase